MPTTGTNCVGSNPTLRLDQGANVTTTNETNTNAEPTSMPTTQAWQAILAAQAWQAILAAQAWQAILASMPAAQAWQAILSAMPTAAPAPAPSSPSPG
jgi:hypothetical protein